MAHWVQEEGLGLDVCSAGELALAVTTGFPPEKIVLHGNAKSPEDLRTALRLGVGRIVVDSTSEIARLAAITPADTRQKVMVRVVPGIAAGGHAQGADRHRRPEVRPVDHRRLRTARRHPDTRPAAPRTRRPALPHRLADRRREAVRRRGAPRDRTDGPHQGAARRRPPQLNIGGGHAIAYRPGEESLDVSVLAGRVRAELEEGCARAGLPVPRLTLEPGRAIVGPAGVAVYRVLAVKRTAEHTFVAVDGGMSDNPRPALYGVRYAPRLIGRHSSVPPRLVTVVGRHCEAGDILAEEAALPGDVHPGDLLAVPAAGAYHLSMASGYNLVGRPPVVAVSDRIARVLVRRESLDDMNRRDIGL